MNLQTRKILDRSFAGAGLLAIAWLAAALLVLLAPMTVRGLRAVCFQGTIEHRRFLLEKFERGNRPATALYDQAGFDVRASFLCAVRPGPRAALLDVPAASAASGR